MDPTPDADVVAPEGWLVAVTAFATDGERLTDGFRVLDPDKLRHVHAVRESPA